MASRTNSMTWVTEEDAHVQEFVDPPFVQRMAAGQDLRAMLLSARSMRRWHWQDLIPRRSAQSSRMPMRWRPDGHGGPASTQSTTLSW